VRGALESNIIKAIDRLLGNSKLHAERLGNRWDATVALDFSGAAKPGAIFAKHSEEPRSEYVGGRRKLRNTVLSESFDATALMVLL
jgi:hypothetical protein